jgi:hypothetical protein
VPSPRALFPACRRSDSQVGEELLRKYVFIHLAEPGDKLQLMLAMLHKLYALVSKAGGSGFHPSFASTAFKVGIYWRALGLGLCKQVMQHAAQAVRTGETRWPGSGCAWVAL